MNISINVSKILILALLAVAALVPVIGVAHPQTERYIPIGQSPGTVDLVAGTISARSGDRMVINGREIILGEYTPVWLDRSLYGRTSLVGDRAHCRAGRFVEVRYQELDGEYVARWVKVRGE